MVDKFKLKWLYIISAVFIALNIFFMVKEFYWFSLLPVLLLVFVLFFFALDRLLLLITFLTPLAITIRDFDHNLSVSLPTEPLLFGVLCLFIVKLFFSKDLIPATLIRHPVSIAIIIQLVWMFITSLTSEIPLVSFKFLLSRLWFIIPFYVLIAIAFRKFRFIKHFVWLYVIPLIGVIGYSTVGLFSWGFDENAAHWVMAPFYNDHTAYGAAIAFFVPVLLGFIFIKNTSKTEKWLLTIAWGIIMAGLILSYSRAAWIGVLAAIGLGMILVLKIRFRWVLAGCLMLIGVFFAFEQQIMHNMQKNKQDASVNFSEHVRSISNITSDASNLERLNRWNAAFRMFKERPVFGWGPGTYQFVYAPFQLSRDKTIISTNAGDRGNAHSEYFSPMTEQGVPGLVFMLMLVATVIWTGIRVYKRSADRTIRIYALVFLLGLVTYFMHGILNNFLDTDKASVLFWGFIAVLVALDIFHTAKPEEEKSQHADEA